MPKAYARAFLPHEIAEHVQIVARRGSELAHAEVWMGRNGPRVCLVAEDRPGLLALVTDALLVHGLSIRSALVYCRQRPDRKAEALDLFELRQAKSSEAGFQIEASELAAFLQTLVELVAEDIAAEDRLSARPPVAAPATRVYFELEALRRGEFVLLVEAPDSEGLLNAITNALHAQAVRILAAEIRTEGSTAYDRFDLASRDGQPLSAVRLCDIQQSVLAALPVPARR
jgi:UTP:GlnB (protein PII) uridylyltransferase